MKAKKNQVSRELKIILRVLTSGKHGEYAVYRPGIGTNYYYSIIEANHYKALCAKWSNVNAMILTKEDPIFCGIKI